MSRQSEAPWELYSKALISHYGFPLWHADPRPFDIQHSLREIELGSVGFVDEGKFRHLFSAMKPKDHPFNNGRVPPTFEMFNPNNMSITAPEPLLRQPYVTSGSVRPVVSPVERNPTSPVANPMSTGRSLSFECKDLGAVLLLDHPAMVQSISAKRHIVTYLRRHMDNWFKYVTGSPEGLGYELEMADIRFVSGTVKTTKWACAAFSGEGCTFKISSTDHGRLDIGVVDENDTVTPNWCDNYGPVALPLRLDTTAPEEVARPSAPPRADQCIFFNYFGLKKKRLFGLPHTLQAGAGPHELPPDDPDTAKTSPVVAAGSASEYHITEPPLIGVTCSSGFDPVAILLDYILSKTDAEYAAGSDADVVAIFGAAGVPDDIMSGLEAINPPIQIDDNGVATIHVDMTWLDAQKSVESFAPDTGEVGGHLSHLHDISASVGEMQATVQQLAVGPPANSYAVTSLPAGTRQHPPALRDPARRYVSRIIWWQAPNGGLPAPVGRLRRDDHIRAFLAQRTLLQIGTHDKFRSWNLNVGGNRLYKGLPYYPIIMLDPEDTHTTTTSKRLRLVAEGGNPSYRSSWRSAGSTDRRSSSGSSWRMGSISCLGRFTRRRKSAVRSAESAL